MYSTVSVPFCGGKCHYLSCHEGIRASTCICVYVCYDVAVLSLQARVTRTKELVALKTIKIEPGVCVLVL